MLDYAANIAATADAARWAHQRGLLLEAELGYIGGKAESAPSAHAQGVRTDPTEAAEFVAQTGVVTIVARDAQRERLILEWGLRYEEPETA
jgi:fructose/tagatose bisphosphate aldolase